MTSSSISETSIVPVLTLGAYLREQEAAQKRRVPAQRRHVPTYRELGELVGVDPMTIYRQTTTSYLFQLPLDLAYRIIASMRKLGFEMDVGDLVSWELPEGLQRVPEEWRTVLRQREGERVSVILGTCLIRCREIGVPPLPNTPVLATAAEISRRQLERILGDEGQRLDLAKLGKLLSVVADYGWGLTPEDVLWYPEVQLLTE